jgi:hypothetical protein
MDTFNIDLHPPPVEINLSITGMELADHLRWLARGRDRCVEFQNGCLIIRGTAIQHGVHRAFLEARRFRSRAVQFVAVWA